MPTHQDFLKEVGIGSAEARLLLETLFINLSGRNRDGSKGMRGDAKEGDDGNELHVVVVVDLDMLDAPVCSCRLESEFCFMSKAECLSKAKHIGTIKPKHIRTRAIHPLI